MNASKALETLAVLALVSLAAGLYFDARPFSILALALLFTGLFLKRIAVRIAEAWMRFAGVLGAFNSRVILALIFYLFLTPLAFVYRLFHGDFLRLRRADDPKTSYWTRRDHRYSAGDLGKIW